jgi:hypothetical protein
MPHSVLRVSLLVLVALSAVPAVRGATSAPSAPPSADPRDLSGVWFGLGNNDPGNARFDPIEGGERPFTAEGLSVYRKREAAAASGHPIRQPADECLPHGVPASARLPTPLQVIQTPGQVTIIQEASRTVRIIYMDVAHPVHPALTFMGHSVGHWEGDVLVVDTVALRENWLDISGAPASEQRHIVERFRKLDGGRRLEDLITIEDPKFYTRSWTARRVYDWHPEERVEEYVCEESERIEPGTQRGVYR